MPLTLPLDLPLDLRFEPAISNRWRTWWHNRLKPSDSHALTLHNVYVLPTRAGWMMLVTLAVLMLATINYQLNLGYVLIFLLLGASVVGLYLAHRAMTRITLGLDTAKALKGIVGEEIEVSVQIPQNGATHLHALTTHFESAGLQPLPLLTCETHYPLGLLRLWTVWRIQSKVQIDLPVAASNTPPISSPSQVDPVRDDFRAYRVGDAPRDLLWKTVAKRPDSPASWGVRERDASAAQSDAPAAPWIKASSTAPTESPIQSGLAARLQKLDQLLLCVLIGIALPFFMHLAWWYPLVAIALISFRLWLTTVASTSQAPKWLQLPLITGLCLVVWLQFHTFNGIEPSVSACLGLLGIKALELPGHRSNLHSKKINSRFSRDRWVLVFLALFTLAAHFLVSQTLLSSILVVLGLVGLIYVLVDAHSHEETTGLPTLSLSLKKSKLKTTASLVLLGAPIMLVLFFLFPRFAPLWTLVAPKTSAVSGLSNEMRVGDISQISLDNRVMLRLSIDPPAQLASQDIYLRGPVLPYFDGRAWRTHMKGQSNDKLPPVELDWLGLDTVSYTIFEDGKGRKGAATYAQRNNAQSTSFPYLEVASALPAQSNPRTTQWLRGLQLDSRYKDYKASDWSAFLLRTLQTGGFSYSLEPGLYGEHLLDELLFDRVAGNKLGFCEHYASFYVIAMRRLGIPARVVTGYQGAQLNPLDGLWVVRNRNAHAWAEYWGDKGGDKADGRGLGWQRVDPTAAVAPGRIQSLEAFNLAPEQIAQRKSLGGIGAFGTMSANWQWLRTGQQTWEATSHAWEQWMQGYNQGAQLSMLKQLGFEAPSWKSMVQVLNTAVILMLLLGAVSYVWAGQRRQDVWLQLLTKANQWMRQAGISLPGNASPKVMQEALTQHYSETASQPQQWLAALEQARFGRASQTNTSDLITLKRRFQQDFVNPLRSHV